MTFPAKESAVNLPAHAPRPEGARLGSGEIPFPSGGVLGSLGPAGHLLFANLLALGQQGISKRAEHRMAASEQLAALVIRSSDLDL